MEKKLSLPMAAGDEIGGWTVVGLIAGGYSGTVYKVRDGSVPPRFGVLKAHFGAEVCATDGDFGTEIAINAEQPIPGDMPAYYGCGKLADDTDYFLSEFLEMLPIDSETGEPLPMSTKELNRFFPALCEVVIRLHRRYVHCDLKPENVALRDGRPALIDFGCACRVTETGRRTVHCGSWEYMAPEVRDAKWVDERADVYSLGVLLRKLSDPRARRVHEALCLRAVANDPNERPQTVAALRDEFNAGQDRLAKLSVMAKWAGIAGGSVFLGLVTVNTGLYFHRRAEVERKYGDRIEMKVHLRAGLAFCERGDLKQAVFHLRLAERLGSTEAKAKLEELQLRRW